MRLRLWESPKKLRRLKKLSALLITIFLCTGTVHPVSCIFASEIPEAPAEITEDTGNTEEQEAEDTEITETRNISSAEDLILLSEKSVDESYTKGVRYILTRDIDLSGREFRPVSIFAGDFDGQGHKITGFSFTGQQDKTGFVRTVTGTGRIRDLCLSAEVAPTGEISETGGIAGVNYGLIEGCSFDGSILSFEIAGGIAGHNMESGIIRNCVNRASVNATRRTGGISGFNEGLIDRCENRGVINADSRTAHEMDDERNTEADEDEENVLDKLIPDSIDIKDEDLFERYGNDLKIIHTGGVAGVCAGTITDSINSGIVGYPHVGYKTGGITGYDRGVISGCRNLGQVFARKDAGGIAGQFEPYAVNAYSEDALKRAGDSLISLSDRIEDFHKDFGNEDDITQSHIDTVRATSDELRQLIKDYKEYYRCKDDSVEKEIHSKVDRIREIGDSIELRKYDRETKEALQTFIDNSGEIKRLINVSREARDAGVNPDMTYFLEKIRNIAVTDSEAVDTLIGRAIRSTGDAKKTDEKLEELRDASNDLDEYLRGCIDDYKHDLRITSDDIQSRTDRMADEMDILSEGLKDSDSAIRKDIDSIVSSLNSLNDDISDSYKEVQAELQKLYDTDEKKDVFDDISDDPDPGLKKGVLLDSINEGEIESDINCGGIVGIISEDPDSQSDFEVVSEGQISLNYERYEKATVLNCRNTGDVTVRNDCAGGIAGRADLGAVISSNNFGRIESLEGSYAGGIAGRSAYMIRGCHSRCEAVSEKYAGGIAGLAHSMVDNICLSAVEEELEFHGAVAGDTDNADREQKDRGTVSGNIFVYRGLGAINGVTDRDEAKAVSHDELLDIEGLSGDFGTMTVVFKDDGKTVKRIFVPYGGSVSEDDYPGIKGNPDGQFGYWEDKDLSSVEQNVTVNAVYVDYVTSVASDSSEKPGMIVNGRFYDGTDLYYSEEDRDQEVPEGNRLYKAISFEIRNPYGVPDNLFYTVRYRAKGNDAEDSILIKEEGKYITLESRRDGDYIVFEVKKEGTFYLAHTRRERVRSLAEIAAIAGASFIVLVLIISALLRKRKEKRLKQDGRE